MSKKTPTTFILTPKHAPEGQPIKRRLVKAISRAQALAHANEYKASIASKSDLEQLLPTGIKIEIAGDLTDGDKD